MYGYDSFYVHFLIFYLIYGVLITCLYSASNTNINNRISTTRSLTKVLFLALPLYLLGILRGDTVGGDLEYYLQYFDDICQINRLGDIWNVSSHEPGYQIFTYLISRISHSHRAFFIGTFTLSFIGPVYLIHRYSKMPFFSFILYYALGFYTNTFNNVRQSIAISICFLSIGFLFNKQFRKFCLTVLIAAMFHYSAVFFLILYPLVSRKLKIKNVLCILICGIVLYFVSSVTIVAFLLNVLAFKYDAEAVMLASEGSGWGLFLMYFLILTGELFLFSLLRNNENRKRKLSFFIYMQMLAVLFQMYAPLFASMTRLTYYFYIPIIIAIPYIVNSFKSFRPIVVSAAMALAILFLGMTYSKSDTTGSNSQGVIPYVFIDKTIY